MLRLLKYPYASTRARALATRLLSAAERRDLCGLRGREEVAKVLASRYFSGAAPQSWETERLVRWEYLIFGRKVARSLAGAPRRLLEAWLRRSQWDNLKVTVSALARGRSAPEIQPLLLPALPGGPLSSPALLGAGSLDELIARLPREPFRAVLRQALRRPEMDRAVAVENALDGLFWQEIVALLDDLPYFDRLAAGELLGLRADLDRLQIVRRGRQAGLGAREIAAALPPLGGVFPPRRLSRALHSEDADRALGDLLPPPRPTAPLSPAGEAALARRLHERARRELRSHPFDLGPALAAVLLKELEVRDVQVILGGLRFGLPQDEIAGQLAVGGG
jgi:vacuolar-type H+-ATPase subunit C/Vma6